MIDNLNDLGQQVSNNFCYLYTRVISSTYIGYIELSAALLLLVYTIRHWRRLKKLNSITRNLKYIYITIITWIIFLQCQMIICQTVYWVYHSMSDTQEKFTALSVYSQYVFFLDVLQFFVLQGLILLVCYNWMQIVIKFLQKLSQYQDENQAQTLKYLKMELLCKKIIQIYFIFRFFLIGILLIFTFAVKNYVYSINLQMIYICLLVEAFFLPLLLGISIYTVKNNIRINQIMDEQQISRLINQYIILIVCTIIKFGFGLYQVVSASNHDYNVQCKMDYQVTDQKLIETIILFVTQFIFEYYLPIWVILRIFNVEEDNQISQSLLQTQKVRSHSEVIKS